MLHTVARTRENNPDKIHCVQSLSLRKVAFSTAYGLLYNDLELIGSLTQVNDKTRNISNNSHSIREVT